MKLNKLYLYIIIGTCALLNLAACSKDDATTDDGTQTAIKFEATTSFFQTRSIISTNTDLQAASGFGVFAYYTEDVAWANTTNPTPDFMYNQLVTYNTDHWTYTPVKYWPNNSDHKVSFFAYAPHNGTGITAGHDNTTKQAIITYTWGTTNDLLFDNSTTNRDLTKPDISATVPFTFRHAVANVEFKVRRKEQTGSTITLHGLTVTSDANTAGTFNLVSGTWTAQTGNDAQPLSYSTPDLTVTGYDDTTAQTIGSSIMMPGTWTLSYDIDYTIGTDDYTPLPKSLSPIAMEMGHRYTVVFVIDGDVVESYVLREREAEQW